MKEKQSVYALVVIMTIVALTVMLMTNFILYQVAFEEKSNSLIQTAQSQARLIEAIARYNRIHNRVDWEVPVGERGPTSLLSERAAADTIEQLRDAHQHYQGFGDTGEFLIAGIEHEQIVFLLRHRHTLENEVESVPLYSANAEPMRRALFAQSGIMVGKDYRGVKVLAAYEPVDVLNFGIVAKVDLAEIRAPFIAGVIETLGVAIIVIILGAFFFRRITDPIISKIKTSEQQYRTLIEDINEWVWATDPEGMISFSSAQGERILGYGGDELIGLPLYRLFTAKIQDKAKHFLTKKANKHKALSDYEVELVTSDNKIIPVSLSASPIFDQSGEFLGYRGVAHDITERKHAELLRLEYQDKLEAQVKQRTQALEDINDEMKKFTYIVSHDLRSPLVSVIGFCGEIKEDMDYIHQAFADADLSPQVQTILNETIPESLGFIDSAANKMNGLINNILNLSRIGERKLVIADVDVTLIINETLGALAYQLDGATVNVGQLPIIQSDSIAIEQIFGNIIGNAVKFLEPTRPAKITISADEDDDYWIFNIEDNGIGIAQKDISRIFELFKRVGTQHVQGEGMGLTYVHNLIKRLHGQIFCESELDKGTKFIVFLPKDATRLMSTSSSAGDK